MLDSDKPIKVVENGQLLGVVDDEDILRVIVAEEKPTERAGMSTTTAAPPASKEQSPAPAPEKQSRRGRLVAIVLAVFVVLSFPFRDVATLPSGPFRPHRLPEVAR